MFIIATPWLSYSHASAVRFHEDLVKVHLKSSLRNLKLNPNADCFDY